MYRYRYLKSYGNLNIKMVVRIQIFKIMIDIEDFRVFVVDRIRIDIKLVIT